MAEITAEVPEVIRAKRLELVDDDGNIRCTIGHDPLDDEPEGYGNGPYFRVRLYSADGKRLVMLSAADDGHMSNLILDGGETTASLKATGGSLLGRDAALILRTSAAGNLSEPFFEVRATAIEHLRPGVTVRGLAEADADDFFRGDDDRHPVVAAGLARLAGEPASQPGPFGEPTGVPMDDLQSGWLKARNLDEVNLILWLLADEVFSLETEINEIRGEDDLDIGGQRIRTLNGRVRMLEMSLRAARAAFGEVGELVRND